jgi:hypothetical protein
MTNRHIIDRALPERSKLKFFFPNPTEGEDYFVAILPFFENPRITERKKARFQKYDLISRSSNLYSYLGANSRQFNVDFNITLDHIRFEHPDATLEKYVPITRSYTNPESEKARFLKPANSDASLDSPAHRLASQYTALSNVSDSAKQVLVSLLDHGPPNSGTNASDYINNKYLDSLGTPESFGAAAALNSTVAELELPPSVEDGFFEGPNGYQNIESITTPGGVNQIGVQVGPNTPQSLLRTIDMIIYWVNIIRSSVTNYSQNPLFGPPILRLTHGIMYEDVPCICKDYNISYNEAAGYDMETLLPRQIKVSMKLEEFRAGNFEKFDATSTRALDRDNNAGWESVVLSNARSMDPGGAGRIA